jgi:hypothetical protein
VLFIVESHPVEKPQLEQVGDAPKNIKGHKRRLYADRSAPAVRSPSFRCRGSPPMGDFAAMARSKRQHRHGGEKWEQYTCTSS